MRKDLDLLDGPDPSSVEDEPTVKVDITKCFQVPVVVGSLFGSYELDVLRQHILNNKDVEYDEENYHTYSEDTPLPDHPAVDDIINKIMDVIYAIDGSPSLGLECTRKWAHIHERNMSTELHDHEETFGVTYYVSVPEGSGDLVFKRPHQEPFVVPPKEGQFVIFPGWLEHKVTRHHSDDLRISLSFNLKAHVI